MGTMTKQGVALGLVFCSLIAGCGDDDAKPDAGGGTGGTSGTGGSGGMDAAMPTPATRVGNACTAASDCDGPKPACLDEIDPAAPFAGIAALLAGFLGGGTGGAGLPDVSIEAPGGYCTSQDCTNDMQCGDNSSCLSVTALLDAFSSQAGGAAGGIDIGAALGAFLPPGGGFCLLSCVDDGDCTREGYACRPLLDAAALTGPDGGFAFPADAGFALPDGGFSLPDGGFSLPDGGIVLPTYCLPYMGDDTDAGGVLQ